jgi:hypothetical protein
MCTPSSKSRERHDLIDLRPGSLLSATKKEAAVQFWITNRRGAVEIATFSNPPHNYLDKPVIDELEQLVVQWRDPSIRAVVIQSRDEDAGFSPNTASRSCTG